jgi:hypothetical protein
LRVVSVRMHWLGQMHIFLSRKFWFGVGVCMGWPTQSHPSINSSDQGPDYLQEGSQHPDKIRRTRQSVRSVGIDRFNDPSAGSPTETLLRLLLPLGGRV